VQELLDAQGRVFTYGQDQVALCMLNTVPDQAQLSEHAIVFANMCRELGVDGLAAIETKVFAL